MASERYVRVWDPEQGKAIRIHRVAAEVVSFLDGRITRLGRVSMQKEDLVAFGLAVAQEFDAFKFARDAEEYVGSVHP